MTPRKKTPPHRFEPHAPPARSDDANAFFPDPGEGPAKVSDDLAEGLAEDFLEAATTAQAPDEEFLDSSYPEEIGGPFVETSAAEEMAGGTDASNPADAAREPLPRAVAGIVAFPNIEDPGPEAPIDTDDDLEERDAADPGITPREAEPAHNVAELNQKTGRGRRPS